MRTAVFVAVGAFAIFIAVIAWALCRMARLADEWDEEQP